MVSLKIKITKDILERAKFCGMDPSNKMSSDVPTNCAVALAVRDVSPSVWVAGETIEIYPPYTSPEVMYTTESIASLPLDEEVQEYIDEFDLNGPIDRVQMRELEFEVEVPDSVINLISLDEIKSLLKNSSTMELVEQ